MNQKELTELKRNFTDDSAFFTLKRVITAYVSADKAILSKSNRNYALIPEDEGVLIMGILKSIFSGKIAKHLIEYPFPKGAYQADGAQQKLFNCIQDNNFDEFTDALLAQIVDNMIYPGDYTIILGICNYQVLTHRKIDKRDEEAPAEDYNFLVAAICPTEISADRLMYDNESQSIKKKDHKEELIGKAPTDGFFYPAFNYRSPDLNSVMYYTKSPSGPNMSIVESVLGCDPKMTMQEEKAAYRQILREVAGNDLNYSIISSVNNTLADCAAQLKNEPEIPVADVETFSEALREAGLSEDRIETFLAIFSDKVGEGENDGLTISNIVEEHISIEAYGIKVSVARTKADHVKAGTNNGRRCLIIDLDDPSIIVNGIGVSL